MNFLPLVSIIVPVYNVEKYLKRCIDSLLLQTFTNFELILVDDESTDSSGAICDIYAEQDDRITVIHKKNGGVSSARNAGLDVAVGEYVTFCDSDDYVNYDWLEVLLCAINSNNVDMVASNWKAVDDTGKELFFSKYKPHLRGFSTINDKLIYIQYSVLEEKTGWAIYTRIFKLNILNENNIRFCETCENYAEDLAFVMEYILYCRSVCSVDYCGYFYYQRSNSMMHNCKNEIKLNALNEVSKHFAFFLKNLTVDDRKVSKRLAIVHLLIMGNQYAKLTNGDSLQCLSNEINKIVDKRWYKKQTRKLFFSYKTLKEQFGEFTAKRILLFSSYCLHEKYKLYALESGVFYKFFHE